MVKVVLAGATGGVGREVADRIVAKNKHEVVALSRSANPENTLKGIQYVQVDYLNKTSLIQALQGADTVICFFSNQDPTTSVLAQKNLIDASIEAGVRRFAPSEWATRSNSGISFYDFKDEVRDYLQEINRDKKVLEYTLFQTGLFADYFTWPHTPSKYFKPSQMFLDFQNKKALSVGDGQAILTLTTISDVANVVAEALDYEPEWPIVGGIQGVDITLAELIKLGEKIRGPFSVENVQLEDLENNVLKTSWYPLITHPSFTTEMIDTMSRFVAVQFLKGTAKNAWKVSDDWNKLLPHVRLIDAESFLTAAWEGKS